MKKSWFRKTDALVAAFVVPVLIMIIIFIQRGIFPFGDNSFLKTDLYHQYAPFFSEFNYKLSNGGSLLYSWNIGLGVNFTSLYAYYLASPLNWFLYFIPQKYTIEFITYLDVFKIGLSGLAMAWYLNRHCKNSGFLSAFFAIFYAMSGYVAAYNWNIMWLDCIALFPFIIGGAEDLIIEKKGMLYAITLALCILSNYYISIMICMFLVIYFIMLQILREDNTFAKFLGSALRFAVYSLAAGAACALLLIPVIFTLQSTASGDINFPQTFTQYFSIIDVLARHMINVTTEQELNHWPNLYCGIAVFPLIIMYFINRKISLKEKATYGATVLLFLASFSLNFLNFIWHGFHYPNSLPARQSFIYIFIILFMCYRTVDEIEGNTVRDIGISTLISFAFTLLCQKVVTDDAITFSVYYITLIGVAVYGLMLYLYKTGKANINVLTFVVFALVSIEAAVNMTTTSITTVNRSTYISDNEDVRALVGRIEKEDTDFYRYEKLNRKTKDDGAQMNYKSVSLFSSTAPKALSDFFKYIGCEASVNSYSITGSTPFADALLDVKYALGPMQESGEGRSLCYKSGDTCLYRNQYVLPLGFMLSHDFINNVNLQMGNPALVQNDFCHLLGTSPVLVQESGFHEGNTYSITIPQDGEYYAFSANTYSDSMNVNIETETKSFKNLKRGFFMELGKLRKNQIVDFVPKDNAEADVMVYRFDYDALGEFVNELEDGALEVEYYDDTHVSGNVYAEDDGVLFTSIPYDKGWSLMVDGIERSTIPVFEGFLGIELSAGLHDIELSYEPYGLALGRYISIAGLLLLAILLVINIIRFAKKKKTEAKQEHKSHVTTEVSSTNPAADEGKKVGETAKAETEEIEVEEVDIKEAEIKKTEIKETEIKEDEIKEAEINEAEIQPTEYLDVDYVDDEDEEPDDF